jgi:hypothetical protein
MEIVYISTARPDISVKEVADILKTARKFNLEKQITGCLLYHNKQFAQIIEGEESTVNELFSAILKDKRHFDVKLLVKRETEGRVFSNWSMAFYAFSDSDFTRLGKKNFEDKMIMFSDLAFKPTKALQVFWSSVKLIMEEYPIDY